MVLCLLATLSLDRRKLRDRWLVLRRVERLLVLQADRCSRLSAHGHGGFLAVAPLFDLMLALLVCFSQ